MTAMSENWKEELAANAVELLNRNSRSKVNDNGVVDKWTVPSGGLYPHMWAWDSVCSQAC